MTYAGSLDNFPGNSVLITFKQKITGSTGRDGTKAVQIMIPPKYVSNFWRARKGEKVCWNVLKIRITKKKIKEFRAEK